ncbi:MAG: type IX secretion system protein PorQ [Ignavibacteria bacterium]|nr:type IX secretion system protein PorQ [Ignavibacteria bacterium]
MKKIIFISLIFASSLFSQSTFEFLKLDASARSAALGGAFTSNTDDVNVLFYNPAAFQLVQENTLSLGFLKHLLDINSGYLSYSPKIKGLGKIGVGLIYTNYGDFEILDEFGYSQGQFTANDIGLLINYSELIRKNLSLGVNAKILYSKIYNYNSTAIAADLGVLYFIPEKQFSVGLSVLNLGKQLDAYYNSYEKLPLDIRLGFSKKLEYTPFRFFLEFVKLNENQNGLTSKFNNFIIGGEIYASNSLTFRFGFNNEKRKEFKVGTTVGTEGFSLGLGLNISGYKFDYGLTSFGKIGLLHRINLTTNL